MTYFKKILLSILFCFTLAFLTFTFLTGYANASTSHSLVILSSYKKTLNIGDEYCIIAVSTDGKLPKWKSSSSRIASVNSYGKVTAKKEGTVTITAKVKNGEASCTVTVKKTKVSISKSNATIEGGESIALSASSSNNSSITWKSSRKSVATIDDKGIVTGLKPGETNITATANGSKATCTVKVKHPTITLSKKKVSLYRGQSIRLSAEVSSGAEPKWKTSKKNVALVNPDGTIIAIKNGSATITAIVDGVSTICNVTVKKPKIKLSSSELNLKAGQRALISANVSSGNYPQWSTSNPNVATIDSLGQITGINKGRAYIYAKEDGTKVRCTVYVTD